MNITKTILKKKSFKIIADDKSIVNYEKLKDIVKKNSYKLTKLKIKKDDNVAIILNNSVEFIVTFLSTVNVCVSAPLNPSYSEGEFAFYFEDLKPKIILTNFDDDHPSIKCAKKFNIKIIKISNYIFQYSSNKINKKILSSNLNDNALIISTICL